MKTKSWRLWFALPLVSAALGAGYVVLIPGPAGKAIAAAIADPLAVLALRSPGQRSAGALAQTKAARKTPSLETVALLPTERVLPNVRSRPPVVATVDAPLFDVPAVPGIAPDIAPIFAVGGPDIGTPFIIAPAGPIVAGGGSGGGGGFGVIDTPGGTGTDPGDGAPVDIPAVPEPGTWLMMLMGFFAMGFILRAASRNGRSPARCS